MSRFVKYIYSEYIINIELLQPGTTAGLLAREIIANLVLKVYFLRSKRAKAYTINCLCQSILTLFISLGMYNFGKKTNLQSQLMHVIRTTDTLSILESLYLAPNYL